MESNVIVNITFLVSFTVAATQEAKDLHMLVGLAYFARGTEPPTF